MKKKILMLCMGCFLAGLTAKAQWVVTDPTNLAQGIINAAKNIVHTSSTASNMLNNFQGGCMRFFKTAVSRHSLKRRISGGKPKRAAPVFSVFGIISVVGARYRDAGEDIARFTGIARRIVGDFDFFIKVGRFGNEVYGDDGGFIDEAREFTGSDGIFKVGNAVVVVGFADDADKVRFGQVEKEKAGCLLCVGIKRDVRAGNISIIR